MKNLGLSSLQKAAQHMDKLSFLCNKPESPCQEKATFIFNSQNILGSSWEKRVKFINLVVFDQQIWITGFVKGKTGNYSSYTSGVTA